MRTLLRITLLIAAYFLLEVAVCSAQVCTQSGQTLTAGSVNETDVQQCFTMLGSMSGTVTIQLPNGTAGWTSQLTVSVPAAVTNLTVQGNTTLACSGTAGTSTYVCNATDNSVIQDNITGSNFGVWQINLAGTSSFFRLTGMSFQGGSGVTKGQGFVLLYGPSHNVRIDHNHFNEATYTGGSASFWTHENGDIEGVEDHNLFDNGPTGIVQGNIVSNNIGDSIGFGDGTWANATPFGGAAAWYMEENQFNGGTFTDCDTAGFVVVRYNNTTNMTSVSAAMHSHGTYASTGRIRGCRGYEFYHNYVIGPNPTTNALVGTEGGPSLAWGNTVVSGYQNFANIDLARNRVTEVAPPNGWGYSGNTFSGVTSAWDGNSNTTTGYPSLDGLGRGQGQALNGQNFPNALNNVTGTIAWPHQFLEPIYYWMNTLGGINELVLDSGPASGGTQINRDIFLDNASFNGTTGTGFGLLSARPATCTAGPGGTYGTSPTGSYGVAYWATDANSGNGELYVCTAANTWTGIYQPYTHPHPLAGGGTTNLTLTVTATNGTVSGTNCSSGTYTSGTIIGPCTDTPSGGFNFTGWSGTGNFAFASGTGTIPATALTQNSTLTATNAAIPPCSNPTENAPFGGGGTGPGGAYLFPPNTFPFVVSLTSPTTGCAMHYLSTTDGTTPSAPTCSSPLYPIGGFSINSFETFTARFIACQTGFTQSAVVGDQWVTANGQVLPPSFTPAPGTYSSAQSVVIATATPGATIHYTTDGSTPGPGSPVYSTAISISSTTTLKAYAVATGLVDSIVTSGVYTIQTALAVPTFTPPAGTYATTQSVSLTLPGGSTGCYRTDGIAPTAPTPGTCGAGSTTYSTPISVSISLTIQALATEVGFVNSPVASAGYVVNSCGLSFSPTPGTYTGTQSVLINQGSGCPGGTQVFYRTDGFPATVIDTLYSGPISVPSTQTVTAIAVVGPTIRDQPQTISGNKKCNAVGSPITFPSGYTCNNGSGGVAGTASDFNFTAGTSNQWYVSTTDSTDFDTSILHIDTPTTTPDVAITAMSYRNVFQDSSNCGQTAPNLYKCIDVSEFDAENAKDPTTKALWQVSAKCSTNAAGSSGNNGFIEGGSGSVEKWDIPCVIGAATDVTINTHWTLGDTGCGGAGCMVIDSVYLKTGSGALTEYDFPASCDGSDTNCPNYPMTAQPSFSNFTAGSQQQLYARNVTVAGTSPLTTTRNTSFIRVGVDEALAATGSAAYTINGASAPTFSPVAGSYGPSQTVLLSTASPGCSGNIVYNLTGASSGGNLTGTTTGTSVSVTTTETIYAQVQGCTGLPNSSISSAAYTINGTVATPTFSPVAGSYAGTQSVTISSATGGAGFCYTIDNTTPIPNGSGGCSHGTLYSTAVSVSTSLTLQAVGFKTAFVNSAVGSAAYVITPSGGANVSISGKAIVSGKAGVQ